jgi:prepilin-type N-terminal cleavage/methylation domain-containing protein
MSIKPSTHQHAFTLIELLVVISIISLLIAILLPALSKARAASQALSCMTRIRQIGAVVFVYTQDNRQSLPTTGDFHPTGTSGFSPGNKTDNWIALTGKYLGASHQDVWKYNKTKPGSIWRCPSNNDDPNEVAGVGIMFPEPSYGINRLLTGYYGTHGSSAFQLEPYKLEHIDQQTKTPLLGDCLTPFHLYPLACAESFHPQTNTVFPHDDMGADNFFFLDGHAQRIGQVEKDGDDGTYTAWRYRIRTEYFSSNRKTWY